MNRLARLIRWLRRRVVTPSSITTNIKPYRKVEAERKDIRQLGKAGSQRPIEKRHKGKNRNRPNLRKTAEW